MDIENIQSKYQSLSSELRQAVAKMERSDKVFIIREAIKDLQKMCPHSNGSYDFSDQEQCPYCGKKFKR